MRTPLAVLAALLILLAGCGGGGDSDDPSPAQQADQGQPVLGQRGDEEPAGPALGFPVFATVNTTRVGGADPIANAAGVAQAVYPSRGDDTRPSAITLVGATDWRVAVSAAQLMAPPLRAPILFSDGGELPAASEQALGRLIPTGAKQAGGPQGIRIRDT